LKLGARNTSSALDHKNLFLYNVRNTAEPAYKLSPAEIVAELDGSAASARTTIPFEATIEKKPADVVEYVPPRPAPPRKPPIAMATIAGILGAYLLYSALAAPENKKPATYDWITDPAQVAKAGSALAGVYLTGSEPGQHGIAVTEQGAIKLFQLNREVAPSVIYDTYRPVRLGAKLGLVTNQPAGAIEMRDRDTLVYCDETYRRLP